MRMSDLVVAAGVMSYAAVMAQASPSTAIASLVALTSIGSAVAWGLGGTASASVSTTVSSDKFVADPQYKTSAWQAYDRLLYEVNQACEKYNSMKKEFQDQILPTYKKDCKLEPNGKPKDESACQSAKAAFVKSNQDVNAPFTDCTGCNVLLQDGQCPVGQEKPDSLKGKHDQALAAARREDASAAASNVEAFNGRLEAL